MHELVYYLRLQQMISETSPDFEEFDIRNAVQSFALKSPSALDDPRSIFDNPNASFDIFNHYYPAGTIFRVRTNDEPSVRDSNKFFKYFIIGNEHKDTRDVFALDCEDPDLFTDPQKLKDRNAAYTVNRFEMVRSERYIVPGKEETGFPLKNIAEVQLMRFGVKKR